MELIRTRTTFFYNDKVDLECTTNFQIVENVPKSEIIKINWNNLSEVFKKYGMFLSFSIFEFKKGRIISFYNSRFFDKSTWDIKEWKTTDLNMSIQIDYLPADEVSINDILKYHNSEMAIKYLVEKGLPIVHNQTIDKT